MNQIINCPHCGQPNNVRNIERYLGKMVRIPCGNTVCRKPFEHRFEIPEEENLTVVNRNDTFGKEAILILVESEFHPKKIFLLKEGEEEFGRRSAKNNAQIISEDKSISRRHFKINGIRQTRTGKLKFTLEDIESTNRVCLNGITLNHLIKPFLMHNDKISIGNSEMIFQYTDIKIQE
ncbi:MAG TPA: FHA domain-containing protein [Saprospiraceae bacterium]|nr:FHA domain-containing protein [Saprospiraceae bacterium]HQW56545.1 FHA domain-containing protein [Saprospiraceae bacterium]